MVRATLALACILTIGACASSSTGSASEMEPFTNVGPETGITVVVQNRNFSDARLYALRRGARRSLGVVEGKSDAEFELDWEMTDPIQIRIDLLAGPTCTTEELRADPGDIFELQIDSDFRAMRGCG